MSADEASWSYCAEQRVVNSVDKLGVDSRVVDGVEGSVRLSLGIGRGREGGIHNEETRKERKGGKKKGGKQQKNKISFHLLKGCRRLATF